MSVGSDPCALARFALVLALTAVSLAAAAEPQVHVVHLRAEATQMTLVPGTTSPVFAYNGQIPGPTIDVMEGDHVIVHFHNALNEPTTVHWHGLHLPITADGSPMHPVAPGEDRVYEFTLRPGSAGTYWYHPHPHYRTGYQVAKGLYGAFIVRAADDPLAHLSEQLLILSDNRFNDDGTLDFPDPDSLAGRIDFENGREGDRLFVTGALLPDLAIRSGELQRWRVINAAGARIYRLAMPGQTLLHVGSDGGLFERPVEVDELVLANGERAELLVRGSGPPGSRAVLQSLPYDRYVPQTRPSDWDQPRDLLTLTVANEPVVPPMDVPSPLRAVPLLDPNDASATRVFVMTQGFINQTAMDMSRVDVVTELGATEVWEIENLVGMDHPFHLHGFQFQVLDHDGIAVPFRSWKDTVNVPKHSTARIVVRFDNHPGLWMFHCHILSHEDAGMMGILDVRAPGAVRDTADADHRRSQILRGRALIINKGCGDCHGGGSDPTASDWMTGRAEPNVIGDYRTWPANLTPDAESGVGRYTERQIFNALRYGLRPRATPDVEITSAIPGQGNHPDEPVYLGPAMPWLSWRHMPDDDLWAVAAYLKHGLQAIAREIPTSEAPPDHWRSWYTVERVGTFPAPPFPTANEVQPPADRHEQVLRGRALATKAACGDCHGGRGNPAAHGWLTGVLPGARLGDVGPFELTNLIGPFRTWARNLTPHNTHGLGRFSERQIFNALRFGLRPGETPDVEITSMMPGVGNFPQHPKYLAPPMPWPAKRHLSDQELKDLAAYLKHGLKPRANRVPDSEGPPDFWVSDYTPEFLGPYPAPPFPTVRERAFGQAPGEAPTGARGSGGHAH
jgi:FtsP/CotA-like multicopper oxidase with cupredoxin domain/mono/diheme cytochrome c family protein